MSGSSRSPHEQPLGRLRRLLGERPGVHAWKIHQRQVESVELFFVRRSLDMHRAKQVLHLDLTLYHDFREEGRDWRGSSTLRVPPSAAPAEILQLIERGLEAARFARNPPYPLVPPVAAAAMAPVATGAPPLEQRVEPAIRALYREDRHPQGGINSAELFLSRVEHRLLNSEGLEVRFRQDLGLLELITTWQGSREEVELYEQERFCGLPEELLARTVREQLEAGRDRALAQPTPGREDLPVLLVGEPVRALLAYYRDQTSAENVYRQVSTAVVGRPLHPGSAAAGPSAADAVTLRLDPALDGSPDSTPFDGDGFPLAPVTVLEQGIVRRLWGSLRFCHYLGAPPTGEIGNFLVEPGSRPLRELASRPHLELRRFSDFRCNTATGDFGGEIRLGYLVDGGRRTPITGGSIGGNLLEVQQGMLLSRELQQKENFRGPRALLLPGVAVAGG